MKRITNGFNAALVLLFVFGFSAKTMAESDLVFNHDDVEILSLVQPNYPALAVRSGVEGEVTLSYDLNRHGQAVNVRVVKATPKRVFTQAAVKALKESRFAALNDSGESIEVKGLIRKYSFELEKAQIASR